MKIKRILITYLNNGNLQSQVSKEYLFNKVVNELLAEGREIKGTILQPLSKVAEFTDGSKVYCYPASMGKKGLRCTHVYIDNNIKNISNGEQLIAEAIKPCVIRHDTDNFDISGKQISYFTFDGELKIN